MLTANITPKAWPDGSKLTNRSHIPHNMISLTGERIINDWKWHTTCQVWHSLTALLMWNELREVQQPFFISLDNFQIFQDPKGKKQRKCGRQTVHWNSRHPVKSEFRIGKQWKPSPHSCGNATMALLWSKDRRGVETGSLPQKPGRSAMLESSLHKEKGLASSPARGSHVIRRGVRKF